MGSFPSQVNLEQPQKIPDQSGGYSVIWSKIADLWVRIEQGRSSKRALPHGQGQKRMTRVELRNPIGIGYEIKPGMRFSRKEKRYDILSVTGHANDPLLLICETQEEVA